MSPVTLYWCANCVLEWSEEYCGCCGRVLEETLSDPGSSAADADGARVLSGASGGPPAAPGVPLNTEDES